MSEDKKRGGNQGLQSARIGKRMLLAREVMQRMGQNPIENMARNAAKAELKGDYSTALRGWAEIQTYIEPRRKPVDPIEQLEKGERIATLQELQRMKLAILKGHGEGSEGQAVIDVEAIDVTGSGAEDLV